MSDQTVSVLQLVKRKDADSSDIDTLNLLSLPTELQYQGWQQALPQPGASSVDEVVTLLMNAGNADTLATSLQAIDTKIKETQWAQDPLNPIGVWLRSQLQGETGQRQAFILDMSRPAAGLGITNPLAYQGVIPDYGLGIKRMPVWENVLAQSITSSAITVHGGTVSYTVGGDAHGRIAQVHVTSSNVATEAWFGIKSGRYGVNPANFVPVWNLAISPSDGTDTTIVADATALNGNKLVCTFGTTTTMDYRALRSIEEITANKTDQRGKYIVLLRAKTTNSSLVVNAWIGYGYYNPTFHTRASFAFQPRYQIPYVGQTPDATTGWKYYTLGQVYIAAAAGGFDDLSLDNTGITVQAEKVSGTGNLEMDSLILIPQEHSAHVIAAPGTGLIAGGGGSAGLYLLTRPDKRTAAFNYNTFVAQYFAPDTITWSIPSGSGVIVCAGSSSNGAKTDTFTPTFTVYPSYNSLRGTA